MTVASGFATSYHASPQLAEQAVLGALQTAGRMRAHAILLFLSADFAAEPRPALLAAARAGQTMAVSGCTALGLMTEADWMLDVPAAAAMVFCDDVLPAHGAGTDSLLSLAAPNALDLHWLNLPIPRYGGVAGDATGLGPYKVWQHGQLKQEGRCELALGRPQQLLSHGMQLVGAVHEVSRIDGFDLHELDGRTAWATLYRHVPSDTPLHQLALATLDAALQPVQCWPLVSLNDDRSITVAARLMPGERVCWMQRSPQAALHELAQGLAAVPDSPRFGLLFSCGSRGPALHDGVDREWQAITERFPGMPLLGFYGNGQIMHRAGSNRLLHHGLLLSLFS